MSQPATAGSVKITTDVIDVKPADGTIATAIGNPRASRDSAESNAAARATYGADVRHKHGSEEGKRIEDQEEKTAKLWMEWRRFKAGQRKIMILDEKWTNLDNKRWLRNISGLSFQAKTETEMNHYFDSKVQTESEK